MELVSREVRDASSMVSAAHPTDCQISSWTYETASMLCPYERDRVCGGAKPLSWGFWGIPQSQQLPGIPFGKGGLRGSHTERCRRISCRESEDVPQFFFLVPQEWGIEGVERRFHETKVASGSYCGSLESLYILHPGQGHNSATSVPRIWGITQSGPWVIEQSHACYNSARRVNEHRGREDPQDWGRPLGRSLTIPQGREIVRQEHLLSGG
jgi:hypothetical protein